MNNGIQGYNVQEEQPKESNGSFKTIAIIVLVVALIVAFIFWFRGFYKNNMVNYKAKVGESLDSYYVSGDTKDLKPIMDYFIEYENNIKIKEDIQSYSYDEISKWVNYLDEKYVCTVDNLNSCELQLNEYNEVLAKIERLYTFKEVQGYKVITNRAHSSIIDDLKKKISYNEEIISSVNAKAPMNEDEIRKDKCNKTNDCSNCRGNNGINNVCTCVYINNGVREEVLCKDKVDSTKKN